MQSERQQFLEKQITVAEAPDWRCISVKDSDKLYQMGIKERNITMEQYIESEGKAIKWLVEKCENRYHRYNSIEGSEPTELLEKMEEMVSSNGGAHFKIDRKILQEMEEIREFEEQDTAGEGTEKEGEN
ncbi:hypothetical protein QTP86_015753, partial [Hemibagrus guttatus]